jgi:hypothetical protein
LEVLIAFAITAMAILPLIAPHFSIFRQQLQLIDKVELDMAVNRFYGLIVEKLHRHEIGWGDIEQKTVFPIDDALWSQLETPRRLPFKGSYQFLEVRHKKNEQYALYKLELIIAFEPIIQGKETSVAAEGGKNRWIYQYTLFVARLLTP